MIKRVGRGPRVGSRLRLIRVRVRVLKLGTVVALPSEGGAEKRERLAGAGGGLKQGMAMAVPLGPIKCRDNPTHESQLGTVGFVGELHGYSTDVVHISRVFRDRIGFINCRFLH